MKFSTPVEHFLRPVDHHFVEKYTENTSFLPPEFSLLLGLVKKTKFFFENLDFLKKYVRYEKTVENPSVEP